MNRSDSEKISVWETYLVSPKIVQQHSEFGLASVNFLLKNAELNKAQTEALKAKHQDDISKLTAEHQDHISKLISKLTAEHEDHISILEDHIRNLEVEKKEMRERVSILEDEAENNPTTTNQQRKWNRWFRRQQDCEACVTTTPKAATIRGQAAPGAPKKRTERSE